MSLREYLRNPATYVGAALVAGPAISGLAELLTGGNFVDGATRVLESPKIGTIYLLAATGAALLHSLMRRSNLSPINLAVGTRGER